MRDCIFKILILLYLCLSGFAIISCDNMKKYKWVASVTSPNMYPIMVDKSILIYQNGYTYLESGDYLAGQWGRSGSKNYTDTGEKPIPYRLVLCWLSWAESKFYKGVFDLPTEKMEEYFKEGYINDEGKWETYHIIVVGMAPEGMVVVWLQGRNACVEIGRFQGYETNEISVQDIAPGANGLWGEYPSIEEYSDLILEPEVKEYIIHNGLSNHIWDKYRERFSFKSTIESDSNNIVVKKIHQQFYNGESKLLTPEEINTPSYSMQARIKRIVFDWFDGEENYKANITFNEKEIFNAYDEIYKNDTTNNGELVIKLNSPEDIHITFKNKDDFDFNEIMLHNSEILIYRR